METPGRSHQAPSMVTMRLLGSMELWLANTFLPLLLLTWLPVGRLKLHRQGGEVAEWKWCGEKNYLLQVIFAKADARTYTCTVENTKNMSKSRCSELSKGGTASQMANPVTSVQFEICVENLTVQVKWCRPECPEGKNQNNIMVLRENCMNFTSSSLCTASTGICMCRVFITRPNSTDTGNSTQQAAVSYGCAGPQTDVTGKIWTGFNLLLCILLGLAVGTLLYMPVIGFLLWQCRRNRTGELMSGEVAEGNQAAPVTGTEDLTYANLNFEKKGTGSASSNVIYTEIKPSQQRQSGRDGSAASTEVDVSLNEEGK